MLYIRIKENSQQAKAFSQYIKTLPFVEIFDEDEKITKAQLIEDIKTSLKEVKAKKSKPLKRLLNGK